MGAWPHSDRRGRGRGWGLSTDTAAVPSRTAGRGWLPPSLMERPEVRKDRTLSAFLSVLAHYARGFKDTCYPSVARLAHDLGCCPGHVRRQIRKAKALGLIALVGVAWNRCRRVFKLTWKPDLGVDPRDRTGTRPLPERTGTALPERTGTAPYPSAQGRPRGFRAQAKNAGGVDVGSGEPPPPPAREAEAEAEADHRTPRDVWKAIRAKTGTPPPVATEATPPPAVPAPPPAEPKPPAPPLKHGGRLVNAMVSPQDEERLTAEIRAKKEARAAQRAAQTPPPATQEPSTLPASPRGWLGGIFKRPSK